ncbi:hypothetical protein SAY87_031357 [Trapa incisa]|uniref:Uncharacterized protein n=1 Tax=Trapa incisa TaxID=236973 RepID=A0AAN7QPI3_9MYRT|nr:hypothetical protein SAY87_031357 [Trapa incisa]
MSLDSLGNMGDVRGRPISISAIFGARHLLLDKHEWEISMPANPNQLRFSLFSYPSRDAGFDFLVNLSGVEEEDIHSSILLNFSLPHGLSGAGLNLQEQVSTRN